MYHLLVCISVANMHAKTFCCCCLFGFKMVVAEPGFAVLHDQARTFREVFIFDQTVLISSLNKEFNFKTVFLFCSKLKILPYHFSAV